MDLLKHVDLFKQNFAKPLRKFQNQREFGNTDDACENSG